MADSYPQVTVRSREDWRAWLTEHHASDPGVWVVTYKKASGRPHVGYEQTVEEALAFGWVDSRPRKLDDQRSQLLVTPRKPTSSWSRANKQRIERLTKEDRMTPPGIAAVKTAKANGTWGALHDVEQLIEPDDLRAALDELPQARSYWEAFPRSTKRAILDSIGNAKRPETRHRRVTETARLAAENVRANQWRQPKGR